MNNSPIINQLKQLYSKHQRVAMPLISGLSSLIIILFVIIPQIQSYIQTESDLSDTQKHADSLEAKASELQKVDLGNTSKELQTVLTYLPSDPDVPNSMIELTRIIRSSNLNLKGVNYISTSKSSDGQTSFQLSIVVSGSLANLRTFLTGLSNSTRIFKIGTISVQTVDNQIEASLPVSVFYSSTVNVKRQIDQPISKLSDDQQKLLDQLISTLESNQGPIVVSQGSTPSAVPASGSVSPLGKTDPFQ